MTTQPDVPVCDPVLVSFSEGLAEVRLNRPASANGMNVELLRSFHDALMQCHGHHGLRAVLLSGEGANFCAGGDVKTFASKGELLPDYLRPATSYLQTVIMALIRLEAPVITAVQGYAAGGGGFGLVCASDLVIAADTARFLPGATRVGMAPDGGATVILGRLVGLRRAAEIFLTNQTLTAEEARNIGLINRVVPETDLAEASLSWAREVAAGAPRALAATKRLLWNAVGVEAYLAEEARTVSELSGTADSREGLAAVIERRKPTFTGR